MAAPRFIELSDLPRCEPNVSHARVFTNSTCVVAMYDAKDAQWPNSDSWAVVRFDYCLFFQCGGPNDEAFTNHPLARHGLMSGRLQEVMDGDWIRERATIADKSGNPARLMAGRRHFVFALKENTFECIAKGYTLLGLFNSESLALDTACQAVRERRS